MIKYNIYNAIIILFIIITIYTFGSCKERRALFETATTYGFRIWGAAFVITICDIESFTHTSI